MADYTPSSTTFPGGVFLKVNNNGKATKRHIFVSKDNTRIYWEPSRKSDPSEFVYLNNIEGVVTGYQGQRLEKFSANEGDPYIVTYLEDRLAFPKEDHCGWLEKNGGANGGHSGWKRRWFVLSGTNLLYFAKPTDLNSKGVFSLVGCNAVPFPEDNVTILLTWPGTEQPIRELRCESPLSRNSWLEALKNVMKITQRGKNGRNVSVPIPEIIPQIPVPRTRVALTAMTFLSKSAESNSKLPAFVMGSYMAFERFYSCVWQAIVQNHDYSVDQQIDVLRSFIKQSRYEYIAKLYLIMLEEELGNDINDLATRAQELCKIAEGSPLCHKVAGRLLLKISEGSSILLSSPNSPLFSAPADPKSAQNAIPYLQKAAHLYQGEDVESVGLLARAYELSGNQKLAQGAFEFQLLLDSRCFDANAHLSRVLFAREFYEPAISAARAALRGPTLSSDVSYPGLSGSIPEPGLPVALRLETQLVLGLALECVGRLDECAPEFRACLDLVSSNEGSASIKALGSSAQCIRAHRGLARSLLAKAKYAIALEHLLAVYKWDPSSDESTLALAEAYYECESSRFGPSGSVKPVLGAPVDPDSIEACYIVPGADRIPSLASIVDSTQSLPPTIMTGVASVDSLSSVELLALADELVVEVLTRSPISAFGNLLCGLLYERLALWDARHIHAAVLAARARGQEPTEDELCSPEGWTVGARLETARRCFEYVSEAYPLAEWAVAPCAIARLCMRSGDETGAQEWAERAVSLAGAGGLPEANDILAALEALRRQRDAPEGADPPQQAEQPKKITRASKDNEGDYVDVSGGFVADANMTAEERNAAFFAFRRNEKKRREEEEKAQEEARLNSMTPEERAEYERAKADAEQHEAKKDKVISKHLGQYGGSTGRSILSGRGRGRGRGK